VRDVKIAPAGREARTRTIFRSRGGWPAVLLFNNPVNSLF
jgi:hypothetical protein